MLGRARKIKKKSIFISHVHEEVGLARILREPLAQQEVEPFVNVFLSESIPVGEFWFDEMMKSLSSCDILIVICSQESLQRPWINFEIGFCFQRQTTILSVCHSGLAPKELPAPLSALNSVEANVEEGIGKLFTDIAWWLGWPRLEVDKKSLVQQVLQFEAQYKAHPLQMPPTDPDLFCPISKSFEKTKLETAAKWERRSQGPSNLWYIVINTELFNEAKDVVIASLREACTEKVKDQTLYDASVWSLLGAAELMVRFRADESTARSIQNLMLKRLDSTEDGSSQSMTKSLLESAPLNPVGFTMIQMVQEMVPNRPEKGSVFDDGSLFPQLPLATKFRSIKVFIRLFFPVGLEPDEKTRIISQLHAFTSSVESFAITREQGTDPVSIIIEAHYPCGHFGELQELSKALERVLRQRLVKETFLAYNVVDING